MKKTKIIDLLLEEGFFEDKKVASSWILLGKVFADNIRITTPGEFVDSTASIKVKGINQKYVNKGGLKLHGALDDFKISVAGRVAIDAGASTGGFTDCLVQNGAARVYAVDVGYGQLSGKLRCDCRIVNMEKVNISDDILKKLDSRPSLATVDLSYLSLRKAIPIFSEIITSTGEMICLVKPLFEVGDKNIRRSGQISDYHIYKTILIELVQFINNMGFRILGITHSHITGNKGTREFFIRISNDKKLDNALSSLDISREINKSVEEVLKLEEYIKRQ
jgi:23S rRNA (cytidine1920-2'-O)/16S rRNA (cytidine1409-2'-O)-methyltransferase